MITTSGSSAKATIQDSSGLNLLSAVTLIGLSCFQLFTLGSISPAQAAGYCECVGFVKRIIGIPDGTSTAHAADWDNNVLPNYGYQRLASPQVGAIVVVERNGGLDATYGHIGFIVGVQNGKILIEGANQPGRGSEKAGCSNVNTISVTPNSNMSYWVRGSSNTSIRTVNFTGTTSTNRTNVRSAPSTSASSPGYVNPNTRLNFDAWTYGSTVSDVWTGQPDRRWYRIANTSYWIASATVKGNAPGSQP